MYVAEKISGNRFKIAGGTAGLEVSWQVTGIRHDPFVNANRIPVEVAKPEYARGSYLHPTAFGQAAERGEKRSAVHRSGHPGLRTPLQRGLAPIGATAPSEASVSVDSEN